MLATTVGSVPEGLTDIKLYAIFCLVGLAFIAIVLLTVSAYNKERTIRQTHEPRWDWMRSEEFWAHFWHRVLDGPSSRPQYASEFFRMFVEWSKSVSGSIVTSLESIRSVREAYYAAIVTTVVLTAIIVAIILGVLSEQVAGTLLGTGIGAGTGVVLGRRGRGGEGNRPGAPPPADFDRPNRPE